LKCIDLSDRFTGAFKTSMIFFSSPIGDEIDIAIAVENKTAQFCFSFPDVMKLAGRRFGSATLF